MGQRRADSASFLKVLRAGIAAACRNPHLEVFSSAVPLEALQSWLDLSGPVFPPSPPGLCIPGTVIARHKGFSISPSASAQDVSSISQPLLPRTILCSGRPLPPNQCLAACEMLVLIRVMGLLTFPVNKISFSTISEVIS